MAAAERTGGLRLDGVVVDDRGEPVAGAAVTLYSAIDDKVKRTTASDGSFSFEPKRREEVTIDARHDDARGRVSIWTRSRLAPVVIRLKRGRTIVLRVLGDGQPIEGAEVRYTGLPRTRTDDSGTVTLRGAEAFFNGLKVYADGGKTRSSRSYSSLKSCQCSSPGCLPRYYSVFCYPASYRGRRVGSPRVFPEIFRG